MSTPAENGTWNRNHFAVVVGINRYPGISDLKHAKNDARDFYDWLVSPTGGRVLPGNVTTVMADDAAERNFTSAVKSLPDLAEVNRELGDINSRFEDLAEAEPRIVEGSRLYIYGSGHGIVPDFSSGALAMANCSPRDRSYEHLNFGRYCEWYRSSFIFREVLVFADCCRTQQPMVEPMGPPWQRAAQRRGQCSYYVGWATEYGGLAHETIDEADLARGYFTRAIIDGLHGGAARRETGEITFSSLYEYAMTSVEYQLKGLDLDQTPEFEGPRSDPVLRPASLGPLPRKTRRMTLHLPPGISGTIELWRDAENTGIALDGSQQVHVLDLEEDTYELRPPAGATLEKGGIFRVIAQDRDERF
jgi:hypothetical protein